MDFICDLLLFYYFRIKMYKSIPYFYLLKYNKMALAKTLNFHDYDGRKRANL